MGTENRRLYSVGDTADDFLQPHPPHLTCFTAHRALLPDGFFGYTPTGCLWLKAIFLTLRLR